MINLWTLSPTVGDDARGESKMSAVIVDVIRTPPDEGKFGGGLLHVRPAPLRAGVLVDRSRSMIVASPGAGSAH